MEAMRLRKWERESGFKNLKMNIGANRNFKLMCVLKHGGNVEKLGKRKWLLKLESEHGADRKRKIICAMQHWGNKVEKVKVILKIRKWTWGQTESKSWHVSCNMERRWGWESEKVKMIIQIWKWTWGLTESESWCVPCNMEAMSVRKWKWLWKLKRS